MTTNPTPIPEPTSPTAVVVGTVGDELDLGALADAELIDAAPTLLAELADDVESERSLRIQMARELLVLTRAAELPDPSAEDFGGVGKRILAALGVES